MAKIYDKINGYQFICDLCGRVAGKDFNEQESLKKARIISDREKWEWKHPHWQLYCPNCKYNN